MSNQSIRPGETRAQRHGPRPPSESPQPPALERVVRCIARTAIDNEKHLGDLDSVVGDGDFGFSLARGFERVLEEMQASNGGIDRGADGANAGAFLKKVALALTSRCGGTSGPLWGTAFLRAAVVASAKPTLDGAAVVEMLEAAFAGIQKRGSAAVGDKTLLDALDPFTRALRAELERGASLAGALPAAAQAAQAAAEATRELVARRGRAAYTGERSRGSIDPGAAAIALIARELCTAFRD